MPGDLSSRTLGYAEELTDATLGLDAFYRNESGDEVGLAVLDLSRDRTPIDFTDYGEAKAVFAELRDRAADLPEPDRRTYYRQFCESMLAFIEWRQEGLPLAEQVERFLHVPSDPPSKEELADLQSDLSAVLGRLGYEGSVEQQCTDWKDDTTVPAEKAPAVLSELMDEMRRTTLDQLDVAPGAGEQMGASGVTGASFNAKCDFTERTVVINTDPQLTRPWLRKLAVHEGFPGHALQFSLRKHWYQTDMAPADGLLSVVNCASSATFEGIADSGLRLLNDGDDSDRAAGLVGRYQTGIATAAAWRHHADDWTESEIRDWLADRAVYGDEGWVDNRVGFLTAPERATLMWSYWYGEPVVSEAIKEVDRDDREEFVRFLYGRMHSPQSVWQFDSA